MKTRMKVLWIVLVVSGLVLGRCGISQAGLLDSLSQEINNLSQQVDTMRQQAQDQITDAYNRDIAPKIDALNQQINNLTQQVDTMRQQAQDQATDTYNREIAPRINEMRRQINEVGQQLNEVGKQVHDAIKKDVDAVPGALRGLEEEALRIYQEDVEPALNDLNEALEKDWQKTQEELEEIAPYAEVIANELPVVGELLTAKDIAEQVQKGDYKGAAETTIWAIVTAPAPPFVGQAAEYIYEEEVRPRLEAAYKELGEAYGPAKSSFDVSYSNAQNDYQAAVAQAQKDYLDAVASGKDPEAAGRDFEAAVAQAQAVFKTEVAQAQKEFEAELAPSVNNLEGALTEVQDVFAEAEAASEAELSGDNKARLSGVSTKSGTDHRAGLRDKRSLDRRTTRPRPSSSGGHGCP